MKKGFKYYILALGCMIFVSCIHDKIDIIPATKSHEVEFYLQTIATTKPTRAITSVDENHISNLHLLAFDAAGGYLYAKSATSISSSNADGSLKRAKFIVDDDDINENIQLVFIANVPDVQSIINMFLLCPSLYPTQCYNGPQA